MLPVNDLGSDSPLYFSLLQHPCDNALKRINRTVVTSALWFDAQSRCPQTNHRPGVSVETGTCTNPFTECCSAKCSPLASESPRAWIQVRRSVRQLQLRPDRQLANRAAHRRATLRGNLTSLPRQLAASLLSHMWLLKVHLLSGRSALGSVTVWRACSRTTGQVRSKEEHMMSQSRGAVSFEPLFTAEDIGLRKEANVEHVMKVFITLGEGLASRWIEMPKGVLLLQTVPDNPASGAIYLYDRELQVFYFVVFDEGRDDSLTAAEFDDLVTEYNLVSWTAHPALLRRAVGKPGMA